MGAVRSSRRAWTISMEPASIEELSIHEDEAKEHFSSWQLLGICDPKNHLCRLTHSIDWGQLVSEVAKILPTRPHWPSRNLRLVLGLVMLCESHAIDEQECLSRFVENIYWQYFCGMREVQWKCSVDRDNLQRWVILLDSVEWSASRILGFAKSGESHRIPADLG